MADAVNNQTTPGPEATPTPAKSDPNWFGHQRVFNGEIPDNPGPGQNPADQKGPFPAPDLTASPVPISHGSTKKDGQEAKPPAPSPAPAPGLAPPSAQTQKQEKHRFSDHAAAEKAYTEIQSRTTRAETENKKLREELQKRDVEAASREANRQKDEFVSNTYKKAMEDLEKLDRDDPAYVTESAKIWAKVHLDIEKFVPKQEPPAASSLFKKQEGGQTPPGQESPDLTAEHQQSGQESPDSGSSNEEEITNLQKKVSAHLQGIKAGFDDKDPVFLHFARAVPVHNQDGSFTTFDQQLKWAVAQTQAYKSKEKAKILQEAAQPMGNGASPPASLSTPPDHKNEKLTFGDAIAKAREKRVIR